VPAAKRRPRRGASARRIDRAECSGGVQGKDQRRQVLWIQPIEVGGPRQVGTRERVVAQQQVQVVAPVLAGAGCGHQSRKDCTRVVVGTLGLAPLVRLDHAGQDIGRRRPDLARS